jgi:colicin import membrane protein
LLIEYHADPNIGESVGYELYTAKREKPAIAKEMEDYLFSHGADKKAYLAGYQYAEKVVADTKKIKAEGERADEEAKRAAEEAKRAAEEAKRAAEEAAKYAEGANEYRKMIRQLSFIK